jgi:hypothetical protein
MPDKQCEQRSLQSLGLAYLARLVIEEARYLILRKPITTLALLFLLREHVVYHLEKCTAPQGAAS